MSLLPQGSLKRRVTSVLMACSAVVLVAATLVFLGFQAVTHRRTFEEDLRIVTRIIADNCGAPLAFKRPAEAGEVLATLRSRFDVMAAHVHAEDGSVFASFGEAGTTHAMHAGGAAEVVQRQGGRMVAVQPVLVAGECVGSVCVVADYGRVFKEGMLRHMSLLGVLLPSALVLAWLLSLWLQRRISAPVLSLAATARTVTEGRDYAVRASPVDDAELGILVTTFNRMLEQMEHYSEELERAVSERTADLSRARDAAEAANRAKSQFLANMSHEVRTPINGIMGMLHLLRRSTLNPRQQRQVDVALGSSETLLAVLGDVLDFSRIEAGKLNLERVEFDLGETVERPVRLMAQQAEKKGLEMVLACAPDLPSKVLGDPHRLSQILLNLLGNALKFTERGEIAVAVSCVETVDGVATLRFEVRDTGRGIASEDQGRIFAAFEQADASMARATGGVGLGLAISKQLCALMGGAIGVESLPGVGSVFWFTARMPTMVRDVLPDPGIDGLHLLVAAPSPALRETLVKQIEAWRGTAIATGDPERARQLLQAGASNGRRFDLVLTEYPGIPAPGESGPIRVDIVPTSWVPSGEDMRPASHLIKPIGRLELREALASAAARCARRDPTTVTVDVRSSAAPEAAQGGTRSAATRSGTILVADDNEIGLEVIREMLGVLGFSCRCVHTGEEAVDVVRSGGVSLVLMDCGMPGMSGYEASRRIRERERERGSRGDASQRGGRVPIVAMTAHSSSEARSRCLEAGMDDVLSKPVDPDQVMGVLRRWMEVEGAPGMGAATDTERS